MKKFKKSFIALALALVLFISPAAQTFAAEELPTEAVYDMEKGGTQTFTIRNAEGGVDTVTVREVTSGNGRVANGEYEVGYDNTGIWIASFVINVSNNQIYNAHSPFSHAFVGTIKYPVISRQSVTYAYLAFIYTYGLLSFNTGVDAKITNGNIVVTRR